MLCCTTAVVLTISSWWNSFVLQKQKIQLLVLCFTGLFIIVLTLKLQKAKHETTIIKLWNNIKSFRCFTLHTFIGECNTLLYTSYNLYALTLTGKKYCPVTNFTTTPLTLQQWFWPQVLGKTYLFHRNLKCSSLCYVSHVCLFII